MNIDSFLLVTTRASSHSASRRVRFGDPVPGKWGSTYQFRDEKIELLDSPGERVASLEEAEDRLLGIYPGFDWRGAAKGDLDNGPMIIDGGLGAHSISPLLAIVRMSNIICSRTRFRTGDVAILHPKTLEWARRIVPYGFKPSPSMRRVGRWTERAIVADNIRILTADHVPKDYAAVLYAGLDDLEYPGFDFAVLRHGSEGLTLHRSAETRDWLIRNPISR